MKFTAMKGQISSVIRVGRLPLLAARANGAGAVRFWGRLGRLTMRKILCALVVFSCGGAFAACQTEEILECYAGDKMGEVLKDAAKLADKRGKRMFGEDFTVINRIRYSKYGKAFAGDLDAVLPGERVVWQMGMTKWTHRRAVGRHDMRYGGVYRFADAESWHGGMFGFWGFMQHDAGQKHGRAALGAEYEGKYGRLSSSYYMPLSGWQSGRAGYKEKALGGGDLSMRLNLSRKFSLNGRASHWESTSTSGGYRTSARINFDYAPRYWLKLNGGWTARKGADDSFSFSSRINIPLGGARMRRHRQYTADYSRKLMQPVRGVKKMTVREKSTGG